MISGGVLMHTLVVERATAGTVSPRGHASQSWSDIVTVAGLVQERSGREINGSELGGTVVGDAAIFLNAGVDVTERDRIRRVDIDPPLLYDVLFVRDGGGRGQHLEIDARRVRP